MHTVILGGSVMVRDLHGKQQLWQGVSWYVNTFDDCGRAGVT